MSEEKKISVQNVISWIFLLFMGYLWFFGCDSSDSTPKQLTRQEKIESQFTSLHGVHKNLREYVQARLSDPSSFKHIETRYVDNGTTLGLIMKYRALNDYGMSVLGTVTATADVETGAVSDVEQLE